MDDGSGRGTVPFHRVPIAAALLAQTLPPLRSTSITQRGNIAAESSRTKWRTRLAHSCVRTFSVVGFRLQRPTGGTQVRRSSRKRIHELPWRHTTSLRCGGQAHIRQNILQSQQEGPLFDDRICRSGPPVGCRWRQRRHLSTWRTRQKVMM